MRYAEIINEKTIIMPDQQGTNFVIQHNPSAAQFFKYKVNPELDMKGWLGDRDIWIWPAWHAHHHQIANALGLDPMNLTGIYVRAHGVIVADNDPERFRNNPILLRLYGPSLVIDSVNKPFWM